MLADVVRYWKMTSFMAVDVVTSFFKRMRCSLSISGSSSVQWREDGSSWRFQMCFRRLFCVGIEIDQPQCVNC